MDEHVHCHFCHRVVTPEPPPAAGYTSATIMILVPSGPNEARAVPFVVPVCTDCKSQAPPTPIKSKLIVPQ